MDTITCHKEFQVLKEQAINAGFRGNFNVACFALMSEVSPQAWVEAARQIAEKCQTNVREVGYVQAQVTTHRVRFW